MANIYDYLTWRGDLPFNKDPLNEIDSLVFSTLAYGEFETILTPSIGEPSLPLAELDQAYAKVMQEKYKDSDPLGFFGEVPKLLHHAATTKRFAHVRLSGFEKQIDFDQSKQFVAMVVTLRKNLHFLAFRGTDTNLAGWKEDLQMSFMDEVPAQQQAADFANKAFESLEGEFYLGGHSKGGNLAVYAAVKASKEQQDRIIAIYNNDGPGFQSHIVESDAYQRILGNIKTFVPRSSPVGLLLEHGGDYTVVASTQKSILQHDPFSWEVSGPRFVSEDGLSKGVLAINNAIRTWLAQVSMEERAEFVKVFCDLIEATGAKTLEDLTNEKLQSAQAILKAYTHMGKDARTNLKKILDIFFKESRKSIRETILDEIDHLLPKKRPPKSISSEQQ